MSEVQSRGSGTRGRGSFRGGRGGYRGTRGGKTHSRSDDRDASPTFEEQGEVGELKAKYADKLPLLREVAEGWSDEDLVFALQETNGDEAAALDRITSGTISQWGEVKKKQPKTKESAGTLNETSGRGRGRVVSEARGRGRATERGGRGGRGTRAVSQANGTKHAEKAAKTSEDGVAESTRTNGDTVAVGEWANEPGKDKLDSLETDQAKPASAAAPVKSGGWASLFAKPTPPPAPKKGPTSEPSAPLTVPESSSVSIPTAEAEETAPIIAPEGSTIDSQNLPPPIEPIIVEDGPSELPSAPHSDTGIGELTPAKDELSERNLNKLPDVSNPPASQTAASTTASTQDPMNPALPPVTAIRPGMSGHAASALRATAASGRSASYTRKIMEQQEAVVMPGNHAVDRAAVQFGKMGLDGDDVDADEDREEPETRTQLPDDSPAAPRASLPPAPEAQKPAPQPIEPPTEPAAQRAAPGLPTAPQQPQQASPSQPAVYADQYRYAQGQKPYDPFSQQPQHAPATTEPFSNQLPGQGQAQGPQSVPTTAQQDYSQYYGREYGQYYAGYGQGQDNQRSGSAFGTSAQEGASQYATAGPRAYGQQELANSGNNTPNPPAANHQAQHSQHMQQGPTGHTGYPYAGYGSGYGSGYPGYSGYSNQHHNHRYGANRPMFDDARRQEEYYNSQYYAAAHGQGYGGNYKSNMYGGPQHQYSHDYSSSPATSGFAGRDSSYARTSSTQPSEAQQSTAGGNNFGGGMQDPFGRTSSGFGQTGHGSHGGSEDPAKPTGPSPSLQGGRPGSAVNNTPGGQQNLPQSQSGQQGFGAYPQYAGFGNQNAQHGGYGAYGANNAFGGYGGGYGRGGWPGNYGGGQH